MIKLPVWYKEKMKLVRYKGNHPHKTLIKRWGRVLYSHMPSCVLEQLAQKVVNKTNIDIEKMELYELLVEILEEMCRVQDNTLRKV